jgi:hypothetical protein
MSLSGFDGGGGGVIVRDMGNAQRGVKGIERKRDMKQTGKVRGINENRKGWSKAKKSKV